MKIINIFSRRKRKTTIRAWIPQHEIDFVRACQDADKRAKKAIKEAK